MAGRLAASAGTTDGGVEQITQMRIDRSIVPKKEPLGSTGPPSGSTDFKQKLERKGLTSASATSREEQAEPAEDHEDHAGGLGDHGRVKPHIVEVAAADI